MKATVKAAPIPDPADQTRTITVINLMDRLSDLMLPGIDINALAPQAAVPGAAEACLLGGPVVCRLPSQLIRHPCVVSIADGVPAGHWAIPSTPARRRAIPLDPSR